MSFYRLQLYPRGPHTSCARSLSKYVDKSIGSILDRLKRPEWKKKCALVDVSPNSPHHNQYVTYEDLDQRSSAVAESLKLLSDRPVGAFTKPNVDFCVSLLAAWKSNKCFVPLSSTHSINEVSYFVEDSNLSTILCASREDIAHSFQHLPVQYLATGQPTLNQPNPGTRSQQPSQHHRLDSKASDALVIYTSGTTGRPKGVVHTHSSLHHMFASLTDAWQYTDIDRILHFLPLYHMHGLINKLLTVLYNGGTVQFLPNAAPATIWTALAQEQNHATSHSRPLNPLSLFMAVPTVYAKLLEHMPHLPPSVAEQALRTIQQLRLQVSGSAALPDSLLKKWKDLTNVTLLERYGMTEIGMALSNPLDGKLTNHVYMDLFLLHATLFCHLIYL
ncbi:hypothetical protein EON65_22030 [archaeon]|nr:MAG: hypothetical protein EON65_22030 [archaeon]